MLRNRLDETGKRLYTSASTEKEIERIAVWVVTARIDKWPATATQSRVCRRREDMNIRWIWGTALCVVLALLPSLCCAQYSGGNGDSNNPYLISTSTDMQTIGVDPNNWNKYFGSRSRILAN